MSIRPHSECTNPGHRGSVRRLIAWYRSHAIRYPWRATTDPYRIWLSEILLQQTRTGVAVGYYRKILRRFPTLVSLAGCNPDEFLSAWSGAGYYRRARNMLDGARQIVSTCGGMFPSDLDGLLRLPGIGPYTAGAIRNISFGLLTPAIDGNIRRVLGRWMNVLLPFRSSKRRREIEAAFLSLGSFADSPSDFFQSLMELGQRICLRRPCCRNCPIRAGCLALREGTIAQIPGTRPTRKTETLHWYLLLLRRGSRLFFVKSRTRPFLKEAWMAPDAVSAKVIPGTGLARCFLRTWGIRATGLRIIGTFRHAVTFRRLTVRVIAAGGFRLPKGLGKWLAPGDLATHPSSSAMTKALRMAGKNAE